MKNELMGMSIAFISGLFMIVLTKMPVYLEVGNNNFVSFLLLFMLVMMGLGVVKLFEKMFSPKKSINSKNFLTKKKKESFVNDDFIGDRMRFHK